MATATDSRPGIDAYRPVPDRRTDEVSAFERAIVESPFDYAPRGVYADWLRERGDTAKADRLQSWTGGKGGYATQFIARRMGPDGELRGEFLDTIVCTMVQFFQRVRSGVFLRHPIQRVMMPDRWPIYFYKKRNNRATTWAYNETLAHVYAELADNLPVEDGPDDLGTIVQVAARAVIPSEFVIGNNIYDDCATALQGLSQDAVRIGRLASGLPEIDFPDDPYIADQKREWEHLSWLPQFSV